VKIEEMAEKPREKALLAGVESLTDTELLSLIIESGTRKASAFDLAMQILAMSGSIHRLPYLSFAQLTSLSGIKKAKAIRLLACIELSKRIRNHQDKLTKITNAKDIYQYFECRLIYEKQEHFIAVYLDSKHCIIREKMLFLGSLDMSLVHPREVFKEALHMSASCIVVIHNHPSGDPSPSKADIEITKILADTGKIMQIPILDHVIIGKQSFFSFREGGFLS